MNGSTWKVACLLLGSGFCALVYQIVWIRELRLVFGGTTAAAAAVLAIFMGGLGLGGAVLGKRVDHKANPLDFYARLELGITFTAAISPLLLMLARWVYLATGGSIVTGTLVATLVRLFLSALVLGIPTFLMGGTLPAVARAVESASDQTRHRLAWLYGANTIGAVIGAVVSTFFLLELLGTRATLLAACGLNLLVVLLAWRLANSSNTVRSGVSAEGTMSAEATISPATPSSAEESPAEESPAEAEAIPEGTSQTLPEDGEDTETEDVRFVFLAAGIVGFVFFLMEMVWYRMLAPILGGSTYTFGLILAVALLGIGMGGWVYAIAGSRKQASLWVFALTCALEALFVAIPFALGDRVALLALLLRNVGAVSFYGYVFAWTIVCFIVVLPAAIVAGFQFPLLIALLGKGDTHVGAHTGYAYACNTLGAILGSLAGGFGLITLLTATGAWQAVVVLLVILSVIALFLSFRRETIGLSRLVLPIGVMVVSLGMLTATGPTAAWRHGQIGAGRAVTTFTSYNDMMDWIKHNRRRTIWERDGRVASVALVNDDGLGFFINGKADGFSGADAATQVMSGLVGSMLHPNPQQTMVIGLGTGSSAGWLAEVPSVQNVDVVEIEPAIVEVARQCAPVNNDVVNHPKVNLILGDAREVLQTIPKSYDVIFSEPSNPYRAGIASLYTQEFYRQIADRLKQGGIFVQWLQGYEVDTQTIQTVYSTLNQVFPHVETWEGLTNDLLLVCSAQPIEHDVARVARRVGEYPYKQAMRVAWRADGLEGWYSHFIANDSITNEIAKQTGDRINTDDRTLIEFGFARQVGSETRFNISQIRQLAVTRQANKPPLLEEAMDWQRVDEIQLWHRIMSGDPILSTEFVQQHPEVVESIAYFRDGNFAEAFQVRGQIDVENPTPDELVLMAMGLAAQGSSDAQAAIEDLRTTHPVEADAVAGIILRFQNKPDDATAALVSAFTQARRDPWFSRPVISVALNIAGELGATHRHYATALFDATSLPFSVYNFDNKRLISRVALSSQLGFDQQLESALEWEPHYMWEEGMLRRRFQVYQSSLHPNRDRAQRELEQFLRHEPSDLNDAATLP